MVTRRQLGNWLHGFSDLLRNLRCGSEIVNLRRQFSVKEALIYVADS